MILKLGKDEKECGLSYVAFSRAERLATIGIEGGIQLERLTTKISRQKKLKARLKESKRLEKLADETIQKLRDDDDDDDPMEVDDNGLSAEFADSFL